MNTKDGWISLPRKNWTIKEQAIFLKRLGFLLEQGYTLSQAMEFMQIQFSERNQPLFKEGLQRLENGDSFYQIINRLKFAPLAISYTFFGEKNGQLAQALMMAGEIIQKKYEHEQQIKKLLAYPFFLLIFTFMLFFIIQWRILPQFLLLYQHFQSTPNQVIQFYLWVNEHFTIFLFILLFLFLISLLVVTYLKKRKSDYERQILINQIPVIRSYIRLWKTYYISFHLSQLLKNGFSLYECLKIVSQDPKKKYLAETIGKINEKLLTGKSFPHAVKEIPLWQKEFSAIIHHGQISGRIDMELETYSSYCLERFYEKIDVSIKLLQPIMFSLIALWIIMMYFSLLMPTFQMINNL